MMPPMPKRTPVAKRPGVYSYPTRRGTRYVAVAMHDRKQTWLSGFTTAKLADEWREAEVVSMRQGRAGKAPARMTLGEFIDARWWPDVRSSLKSESSVATYKSQVANVRRFLGETRLKALGVEDVQAFKTAMYDAEMGESAMHYAFLRLRQMLEHAVRLEWLTVNPATRIDAPSQPEHEAPLLTLKQVERLLTFADEDRRYGALFTVVVFTGLRWGELARMRWEHIDFTDGQLAIGEGKTRASRRPMWLGERSIERLRVHMTEQMAWAREQGGSRPEYVFVDPDGLRLPYDWFRLHVWYPLRKRLGLAKMHFHDLRHVHATLLGMAKVHPYVAQRRLRHADIKTTLLYTDSPAEAQRDAVAAVEALLA
jgi:integrase